jgi:hypothetical protein
MNIEDATAEVYAKIGRNVVLFQKLEILLKILVSRSEIGGGVDDLKRLHNARAAEIFRKTLGQLAGDYVEGCLGPEADEAPATPKNLNGMHISMKFSMEHNPEYYEAKKAELAKLVADRNDLVHHLLLQELDITSTESCQALGTKLDAQCKILRAEIKSMQAVEKGMFEQQDRLAAFLLTEEGRRALFPD